MKKILLLALTTIIVGGCLKPCYTCTTTHTATSPNIDPIINKTEFIHCDNPREVEREFITRQTVGGITVTVKTVTKCRL